MPIATDTLDAIARSYAQPMTPIRGRRVYRLLMRHFARFDHVLPATAEDGTPALFALAADGSAALCHTDGTGTAAAVAQWATLAGATVTTFYDLHKDSLPVLRWTVWHPGFAQAAGVLTVTGGADVHVARALCTCASPR